MLFGVDPRELLLLKREPGVSYLGPLPMCEVTPSSTLVACELFGTWVCDVPEGVVCIGVPVPFAVTLPQEVS